MAEANLSVPGGVSVEEVRKAKRGSSALVRVGKYMAVRIVLQAITVVIALYLTILIANMGGYVDEIRRGDIRETISQVVDPAGTFYCFTLATSLLGHARSANPDREARS